MDFDFTTETIIPDNTNILTLAGQAVELPVGTTATRPLSAADGSLRYNTDTGLVEGLYGGVWKSSADWSLVTNTPTTVQGYGINNAVRNDEGTPAIIQDTFVNRPVAGTAGRLFVDTTNNIMQRDTGSGWETISVSSSSELELLNLPTPPSTYKTVQDFANITGSRGTFSGGAITNNGDGTVAVSGGTGMIRATDAPNTALYFFNWNTVSSVSLTDNSTNYIYIFYNSGSPNVVAQLTETPDKRYVLLGIVYRAGTTLYINDKTNLKYNETFSGLITRLQKTSPWARESGAIISEPVGLRLAVTAGVFWQGIESFTTPTINTNVGDTFTYWYRIGSSWTSVPGQVAANNTQFNDPATGLVSLGSNRFTNNWVALTVDGQLHVVYGTENSNQLGTVQAADVPLLPPNLATFGFLIGRVIIQRDKSSFVQIDSAFTQPYAISPVTSHLELADLQGGTANEYFHFTNNQHTNLTNLTTVSTPGLVTLTATNTYTSRSITGAAGNIVVTNGNGVSGNPTIDLATAGTAGTYGQVTTDAFGRVTSGGVNTPANGGTGLTSIGTANQVLGVNTGATALEYKTITAGTGISVTPSAGSITIAATGGSGTVTSVAVTGSTGLTVGGSPITTSGTITLTLDTGLQNLASLATTGMIAATATDTWAVRTLTGTTNQITITNGNGVAGNPTFTIATNPVLPGTTNVVVPTGTTAQETGTTDGALRYNTTTTTLRMRTAGTWKDVGTVTSVAATQPAAGLTITGSPITSSGTLTFALANDLAAVEGLTTTGVAVRTATDTWTTRTITGTAGNITITNGDGIAGNPTVNLATAGTAGTYGSATQVPVFTTDAFGRVTAVTNTPITFPAAPVTSVFGRAGAVVAQEGDYTLTQLGDVTLTSPTNGQILQYNGTEWVNATASTGTVTSVAVTGSTGLTVGGSPITTAGTITLTLGTELQGLSTLSANGIISRTAAGTYTSRILTAGTGVSITNGDGVAGNPTITNAGVTSLTAGTGISVSGATGAVTISNSGVTSVNASGGTTGLTFSGGPVTTTGTLTLAGTLITANGGTGLSSIGTANQVLGVNVGATGLEYKTITAGSGITVTPAAGSITIASTVNGTVTSVAATQPAAGLTITGSPITSSGTLVFALANDLAAVEGLTTTGIAVRTATDTWTTRTITGTAGNITITNGDGIAGNPTLNLATAGTAGTYGQVTTDAFGRVTSGGVNTVANGGTGLTATPTNGQLLIGNGTGYTLSTLSAGTGVSVTNGAGTITVANTGVTSIAGTANQITASASTGASTLSIPSAFIAPGSVQVTTTLHETQSPTVSAAGATQGTATVLTSRYNIVTTVAAGTGVILPTPVSPFGTQVTILNRGANPLNVYPNVGGTIANGAVNAAIVIPVQQEATLLATSTTQWWTTEPILTAGTNITLTPGPGTLSIAATGGGGTPGGANTNVQFNNAGAFGGSNAFNFISGANPRVDILGTALTTRLTIGGTTQPNNASLYIENVGDTTSEGLRCYFRRSAAGLSGWITYDYDQNAPNIRVTDEDDDSPYIQFNTIGTGTYNAPLYSSVFGTKGANGTRTGGANAGFAWLIGTNVAPATLWSPANYPTAAAMELDSQSLRIPTGTTAQRPATPAVGMLRYNTTEGSHEGYASNNWNQVVGLIDKTVVSQNVTVATSTSILNFTLPGGSLGTNRLLRVRLAGTWNNASGATRSVTLAIVYGGTTMWADTSATIGTGTTCGWNIDLILAANNSATAQKLTGLVHLGATGAATTGITGDLSTDEITGMAVLAGTAAINSDANQVLAINTTFSGTGITWTKYFHTIELL